MKKVVGVVIALLFVFSLVSCSSLKKEEIVGNYELVSFTNKTGGAGVSDEDLKTLKEQGKVATLVVRDDNTATMDVFGQVTEMTYNTSTGMFVISGENAKATFKDGLLTLEDNSAKIVFQKVS